MTYNYTARESFVEVQSLAVGDSAPCYRHFPHGKYDHPQKSERTADDLRT